MKGSGEHCVKIHEDSLMDAWASSQVCQAVVVVEVLSLGGGFEDGSGVRRFSKRKGSSFLVVLSSYHPLCRLSESNSIAISTVPVPAPSNSRSNTSPISTPPPPPNPPFTTERVDVDELASTVEDPPLGQLTLFKSVFGVGVSLARYIVDNPLWPILATAGLPCSFCIFGSTLSQSGRGGVTSGARKRSDSARRSGARKVAETSRKGRWVRWIGNQWISNRWEFGSDGMMYRTSKGVETALLELSPLDDQDRLEENHLELQDFICHQPKLPTIAEPIPSGSRLPLVLDKVLSIPKKRKRAVRMGEASSSKCKRSVEQDLGVVDADYRHVVLVLPPQTVSHPEIMEPRTPSRGDAPNKPSHPLPSPGVPLPLPPRAKASYGG
ncbi:hypothetical protein GG344DRAFT_70980 [Lentinula edodes]|nr:hypothetical protein GG344DRAFT_70980 [Lentinula edodes]